MATMIMSAGLAEQREHLELIKRVRQHREVSINAQAGCRILDSYEEHCGRLNDYLRLAREILAVA